MIKNSNPSIAKNADKNNIRQPESYWKDLPLTKKIDDVVRPVIKFCFPAILIGVILFVAVPLALSPTLLLSTLINALLLPYEIILIAIAVITVTAAVGLIAITFFISLHFMKNAIVELKKLRQSTGKKIKNPGLGKWSENSVAITKDCEETTKLRLKLIEQAEKSIEISGNYCGGKVFDELLSKIENQLEEKSDLHVKIISSSDLLTKNNRKNIKNLAKKYPNRFYLLETRKQFVGLRSFRSIEIHAKVTIIDGKIGITGGTGIVDTLCRKNPLNNKPGYFESLKHRAASDMDVVLKGSIVGTMRIMFYNLLKKWGKDRPSFCKKYGKVNCEYKHIDFNQKKSNYNLEEYKFTKADSTIVFSSHESGIQNECKNAYLKMIKSAKKNISIANLWFNQEEISNALKDADKKGVKIIVITNVTHSNSHFASRIVGTTNRKNISDYLKYSTNTKFFAYNKQGVIYHKKVIIIDNETIGIGSCNINASSMGAKNDYGSEDEVLAILKSKKIASEIQEILKEDIKNSIPFEKIKKRIVIPVDRVTKNIFS